MSEIVIKIRKGVIKGFSGSWGSGLAFLQIQDSETGVISITPCDNGATVRALQSAFGNVIGEGHTVKSDGGFLGQEIYYTLTDYGIMEAFTPVEEADIELIEMYEKQRGEI